MTFGADVSFFQVLSPETLRYSFEVWAAKDFGVEFSHVYEKIALVLTNPSTSCEKLNNSKLVKNSIVLIERGDCSFVDKAIVAEQAGALAAIVTDSENGEDVMIEMVKDGSNRNVRIPVVFLPGIDGMKKEEALQLMLEKARSAQDPTVAECWIITAKTLGASYDVDLIGYQIQCDKKNVVSAAETLQQMYLEFSNEPRFWNEVTMLIEAVKKDSTDEKAVFYKSVFQQLLPAMQQTLLLEMAEKQKDKVEQSRYLLLLFRLFPESIGQFGVQLVSVLSDLEKSLPNVCPHENIYSQLLVYEISPILLKSSELKLDEALCVQLLKRAVQFFVSLASSGAILKKMSVGSAKTPRTPKSLESKDALLEMELDANRSNDPWDSLLQFFHLVAQTRNWEVGKKLKSFKLETVKSVVNSAGAANSTSNEVFCTVLLVFVYLAFKNSTNGPSPSVHSVVAVLPPDSTENLLTAPAVPPKSKKAKLDVSPKPFDVFSPNSVEAENYVVAAQCAKILTENRAAVSASLPVDKHPWFWQFLRDACLISGKFESISIELANKYASAPEDRATLVQLTSCRLLATSLHEALGFSIALVKNAPPAAATKTALDGGGAEWKYAVVKLNQTTSFACKVILYCLLDGFELDAASDVLYGNVLILSQLGAAGLSKTLLAYLARKKKFVYPNLLTFIVDVKILEELAYFNAYCNELTLDIVGDSDASARKTGHSTRHSIRGAKGDIRSALENQMLAGNSQTVEETLTLFIVENEELLLNC